MSKIKLKKNELKKLIEGFFYKEQSVNEVAGMGMTLIGLYEGFAYKILSAYFKAKKDAFIQGSDKYFHYLAFYDASNFGTDKTSLTLAGQAKELVDKFDKDATSDPEDMATNLRGIEDGEAGVDPSTHAYTLMPKTTPKMIEFLEKSYNWVFDTPGFSDFYKRDPSQMPRAIQPRYNIMLSPALRRQAWEKRDGAPSYVNNMPSLSAK